MVLDARPDGIIYRDIVPEYVNFVRTIYEGCSLINNHFSCELVLISLYSYPKSFLLISFK